MPDWDALRIGARSAWDWGGQLGLGGLVGWYLNRWLGHRDQAADRGRELVRSAQPEVVPTMESVFIRDGRAHLNLRNRGPGVARRIRVTFTGAAAEARVNEIESGHARDAPGMQLADAPFFRDHLATPAELRVDFQDRHGLDYTVLLPVQQEHRADGSGFDMRPIWGDHRLIGPKKLTKKRLREIGGA